MPCLIGAIRTTDRFPACYLNQVRDILELEPKLSAVLEGAVQATRNDTPVMVMTDLRPVETMNTKESPQ
jgi:hypothetical protein